jgi:membrane fusion protein (multidrug efflux system)
MPVRRLLRCLAAALLVAAPGAWAQSKDAAKGPGGAPQGMPVRAVAARVAAAVESASAVGSLRADESLMIRPEIAGRLERIAFAEGQRVQKGSLLAALDAAEVRAQLKSSQVQAKLEAQRLERARDLYHKSFISKEALDVQVSNYERALAKQKEDEAKLAKTEIRAPFNGVAGLRQVSEGAYLAAGTDIARLEKLDQLKLDFRLPEVFLAKLTTGRAVKIAVDAYPEASFGGTIYAIEPAVDEQTRTVLVRAKIANSELKLRPGMFARVQVELAVRDKAVWVPEEAIVPRGRESFVYRVVGGKADLVKVQTGLRKIGEVEITQGLAAGELVITEGTQKIGPGAPVSLLPPAKS